MNTVKLICSVILSVVISQNAFALIEAGKQVTPPGCKNQSPVTGRFSCDAGVIDIVKGFVNVNGRRECAFLEATGEPGVLFVEIDNPTAEFTDQFVCRRM